MNKTLKIIRLSITVIILAASLFAERSKADPGDDDVFVKNLELVQKRINSINTSIQSLKSSLSRKISELESKTEALDARVNERIDELNAEFGRVTFDYYNMINTIDSLRKLDARRFTEKIDSTNRIMENLRIEILTIKGLISIINLRLEKLPTVLFTPETHPRFGVGFSINKFATLGRDKISASSSYELDLAYYLDSVYNFWGRFLSPFLLTLSRDYPGLTGSVAEKWTAMIFSAGIGYKYRFKTARALNISGQLGIFYGDVDYDDFENSTIGLIRQEVTGIQTAGLVASIELSYNQFFNINPIELYLRANNLISTKNIRFSSDPANNFDMGATLISISFGARFCFR